MNDEMNKKIKKPLLSESTKRTFRMILLGLVFVCGFFLGELSRLAGMKRTTETKGSNVKITGSCKTRDSGIVTLSNDQVKITKDDGNLIEGVMIAESRFVSCLASSINIESYFITDLFGIGAKVLDTAKDSVRTVERDPIYENLKRTVMATGLCKFSDSKKESVLTNKLMTVLNIDEVDNGHHKIEGIILSLKRKVTCSSDELQMVTVNENDVQTFLDKEIKSGSPIEKKSYKGQVVRVTALCVKLYGNEKGGKKDLLDLNGKPVKVTEDVYSGTNLVKLYGKGLDENKNTVSFVCDKTISPDSQLLVEEDPTARLDEGFREPVSLSQETPSKKISFLTVTGKCNENGADKEYYEQNIKVVSIEKMIEGKVLKFEGKIKTEDKILDVICDKTKYPKLDIEQTVE